MKTGILVLTLLINSTLPAQRQNNETMVEIIISEEAKSFLDKQGSTVLTISVEQIPCGCVRPREVPEVKYGVPENTSEYEKMSTGEITIYLKKGIKIPERKIKIKLGSLGTGAKLYPTGIEYFNGMDSYCERPR